MQFEVPIHICVRMRSETHEKCQCDEEMLPPPSGMQVELLEILKQAARGRNWVYVGIYSPPTLTNISSLLLSFPHKNAPSASYSGCLHPWAPSLQPMWWDPGRGTEETFPESSSPIDQAPYWVLKNAQLLPPHFPTSSTYADPLSRPLDAQSIGSNCGKPVLML